MAHWVFHLFSSDCGKVVDHAVHESAFGLAHIVHPTTGALNGVDEVVRSASHIPPRSKLPAILMVPLVSNQGQYLHLPGDTHSLFLARWLRTSRSASVEGGFRAARTRCSLRFFGLRWPKIILASNSSWVPGQPRRFQLESIISRKSC